jgi:hypothetical protein
MMGGEEKTLGDGRTRAMYQPEGETPMQAMNTTSPREHRNAIARQATALLGLDGSNTWLHVVLGTMAAEGVFTNAIDIVQAIGHERTALLRGLVMGADRPEFRKAGMLMSTNEGLMATADLWLDPEASDGAYALACEPISLALVVDKLGGSVALLFETSAWSEYQGAFATAMASVGEHATEVVARA